MGGIMDALFQPFKDLFSSDSFDSPKAKISAFFADLGADLRGFFEYLAEFFNFWK